MNTKRKDYDYLEYLLMKELIYNKTSLKLIPR